VIDYRARSTYLHLIRYMHPAQLTEILLFIKFSNTVDCLVFRIRSHCSQPWIDFLDVSPFKRGCIFRNRSLPRCRNRSSPMQFQRWLEWVGPPKPLGSSASYAFIPLRRRLPRVYSSVQSPSGGTHQLEREPP
jgi:hypothetical protein